jgi:hypothetical protein
MAALLDCPQGSQKFRRFDISNLVVTDKGMRKIKQPFQFTRRHLRTPFPPRLVEPFVGNRAKAVCFGQRTRNLVDLALGGGIDPVKSTVRYRQLLQIWVNGGGHDFAQKPRFY